MNRIIWETKERLMMPQPHVKLHGPDYINKPYSSFCMLRSRITALDILLNSHFKDSGFFFLHF